MYNIDIHTKNYTRGIIMETQNENQQKQAKKPIYKQWWFYLIVVIVVLAVIGSIFSGTSDNNDKGNSNNGNSSESTDKTDKTVYIGETVKNKSGIEFTVVSVENTQKVGYSTTTENNFIIVTIRISNTSTESFSQNPNNCTLIKDNITYEHNIYTYLLDDGMSVMTEINPGITKTMSILFETPTKSTEENYSIVLSGYWGTNSVTILLKERP